MRPPADPPPAAATLDALRESEARFRASFERAPVGLAHVGLGGEWLAVNARLCEILGYAREELMATRFQALTHPADLAADLDQALRLLAGEVPSYTMPKRYVRKDGEVVWARLTGSLMRDAAGAPFHFVAVVDEITGHELERLQAGAAEGERLALALDGAEDGVWDWDVATGAVHFSPLWCRMLGYAPDEIAPHVRSWERLVHPDDVGPVMAALEEHFAGRTPRYATEHRVRRRDGGWAWILDRGKVVARDAEGRPRRMVGTHKDITERRLAAEAHAEREAAARRQLAELEAVYRGAPVGLGFLDAELRYVRVNARLAAMNGTSAEAHVGRTPAEVNPAVAPYVVPLLRRVLETAEPVRQVEIRAEAAGDPGTARDWVLDFHPAFDAAGAVVGVSGAVAEITEVKRAEADARRALAREAQVLAQVHDAVITTDLGGRVTGWNAGAERIFGYAAAEMRGESVLRLYFAEDRVGLAPRLLARLRQTGGVTADVRNRRADGSSCWIRLSLSLLRDADGTAYGMIGYSTDLTDRVAAEAERDALYARESAARAEADAARERAEQAAAAKSTFLAGMSHELRTPLNAIAGHLQLIEMGLHGPVSPAQREALGRIDRAQRHLLRLVNDVLNLARLQNGYVGYDVAPVALAPVVGELDALLSPRLRETLLAFDVRVDPRCAVRADRAKLVQVLLNLVSNAMKFTPAGGTVTVETTTRRDGSGDARTVYLRVRDTGVGIPASMLEHIFDPFVQVDTTPAGRAAGTGLGLAISRDLIRGMGGEIRARSTLGQGSAFTISLPAADPPDDQGSNAGGAK